ncbi:MAG: class I SAM-dependent methyltransferase, partial [Pseudomonadota bacterium]
MVEPRLSFGLDAEAYHRHRFAYPAGLWEILRSRCGLGPGARVFEVGAGTGIATGPLLASGAEVTAIEPDPRMAALLRQRLPEVTLQEAPFDEAGLTGQSFDLGCAATSFHWVGPAGLSRVRAALRPGGWWAMWWNIHRAPRGEDAFSRAVQPHYDRLGVAEPSENSLPSQMAWDGPLSAAGFHRITTERLPW